ncbi:MAG: hypothetical protein ABJI81_09140 [Bauldia litoralis]
MVVFAPRPVSLGLRAVSACRHVAPAARVVLAEIEKQPLAVVARAVAGALLDPGEIGCRKQVDGGEGERSDEGSFRRRFAEVETIATAGRRREFSRSDRSLGMIPKHSQVSSLRFPAGGEGAADAIDRVTEGQGVAKGALRDAGIGVEGRKATPRARFVDNPRMPCPRDKVRWRMKVFERRR